jgi:hypothetical protein
MTLIVASIRPRDVVLTSDGRSITSTNGTITGVDDHYQKLFPIPDHPVVIAHMGENSLRGEPVRKFLGQFIERLNAGNFTILEIADRLRDYAHSPIRSRLNELDKPTYGVNLWVAGFSCHEKAPCLVEVFWQRSDNALVTQERHFRPVSIVTGGNGQSQITRPDWHEIDGESVDEVRARHRKLLEQAISAKVDHNSVGGMIHELVITPAEWYWSQAPRNAERK